MIYIEFQDMNLYFPSQLPLDQGVCPMSCPQLIPSI